jgi:hypothetical protein
MLVERDLQYHFVKVLSRCISLACFRSDYKFLTMD